MIMTIYGRLNCPLTLKAIWWAKKEKRVNKKFFYRFVEISKISKVRNQILQYADHNTLPAIFISFKFSKQSNKKQKNIFVGGYDDLLMFAPSIPGP